MSQTTELLSIIMLLSDKLGEIISSKVSAALALTHCDISELKSKGDVGVSAEWKMSNMVTTDEMVATLVKEFRAKFEKYGVTTFSKVQIFVDDTMWKQKKLGFYGFCETDASIV